MLQASKLPWILLLALASVSLVSTDHHADTGISADNQVAHQTGLQGEVINASKRSAKQAKGNLKPTLSPVKGGGDGGQGVSEEDRSVFKYRVNILFGSKRFHLYVYGYYSVGALKTLIKYAKGYLKVNQKLTYNGYELKAGKSLDFYGIQAGANIRLTLVY